MGLGKAVCLSGGIETRSKGVRPTFFRKEPLVMPERGEPRLVTGGDQETRELPFTQEKQPEQRRGFRSRLIGG